MTYEILSVLAGKVQPFRGPEEPSAIAKLPLAGRVAIGVLGIECDEQAELIYHGGPDKALHHYPADHYPFWRAELGNHPLLAGPGAFGENISTAGLRESEVCIGDRFRLGSATVEVSQGRQPCWKQGHRFGVPAVTARMVATRCSGWYYRVLETGNVAAGDRLGLLERPLPQWTVERVFGLLIAGGHNRDPAAARELAGLALLAEPWRLRAANLVG